MPIIYRKDIVASLKEAGYSTYRLRQDKLFGERTIQKFREGEIKLFGERTIQKFREGEIVNADNLALLCKLIKCQPGDLLEYVPDDAPAEKE